jgi:hypothetical protein
MLGKAPRRFSGHAWRGWETHTDCVGLRRARDAGAESRTRRLHPRVSASMLGRKLGTRRSASPSGSARTCLRASPRVSERLRASPSVSEPLRASPTLRLRACPRVNLGLSRLNVSELLRVSQRCISQHPNRSSPATEHFPEHRRASESVSEHTFRVDLEFDGVCMPVANQSARFA